MFIIMHKNLFLENFFFIQNRLSNGWMNFNKTFKDHTGYLLFIILIPMPLYTVLLVLQIHYQFFVCWLKIVHCQCVHSIFSSFFLHELPYGSQNCVIGSRVPSGPPHKYNWLKLYLMSGLSDYVHKA